MKRFAALALVGTLGVGSLAAVSGCESDRPTVAPVPRELAPRPELSSVPDDAVRVAVISGAGDFRYDLVKGQRYYLVDETIDKLITSDVAHRDGKLTIGRSGATFEGRKDWSGDVPPNNQLALYLSPNIERL